MNRTLLIVVGTIVSLFVVGTIFFLGLFCGVSLENHSDDPAAVEAQAPALLIDKDNAQSSIRNSAGTVISSSGSNTVTVNSPAGGMMVNGTSGFGSGTEPCINSVCYALPGVSHTINVIDGSMQITAGKHTLTVSDGRLCIDGMDYGRAPTKGRVRMTLGGRVFVNETERHRQPVVSDKLGKLSQL
jgi:hypothetical protein